ncbi:DUF5954 family protein [Streptomyces sp. NBC_01187]|uniref:DUF5954 family protein n=1 Tax=Streptomyces sp. NBC_01187 TaxID=2903766 RepID=UPI00386F4883|nr:DUF5954 family protein [Streptomyces sp. NBC_01187]
MHGDSDDVPAYRAIRVAPTEEPVAAMADEEAWQARGRYPVLVGYSPVFGVAQELEQGGWRLHRYFGSPTPQSARDGMGSHFRQRAHQADEAGDETARDAFLGAAERLDWEVLDELTVLGERHRVVRAENFLRMGPDGPEPPRPSDPDPARPGAAHELPDRTEGFVLDTAVPTGLSEALFKTELLALAHREGDGEAVRADAKRAAATHPGGVLLPPAFLFAEEEHGAWRPETGDGTSPQTARDALTMSLRVLQPAMRGLDEATRAAYKEAADLLDEERGVELRFSGRHLRLVRVERLIRIGPDGPEPPRLSDFDPEPPSGVQDERLRARGLLGENGEDGEDGENSAADEGEDDPEFQARMADLDRLTREELARRGRPDAMESLPEDPLEGLPESPSEGSEGSGGNAP